MGQTVLEGDQLIIQDVVAQTYVGVDPVTNHIVMVPAESSAQLFRISSSCVKRGGSIRETRGFQLNHPDDPDFNIVVVEPVPPTFELAFQRQVKALPELTTNGTSSHIMHYGDAYEIRANGSLFQNINDEVMADGTAVSGQVTKWRFQLITAVTAEDESHQDPNHQDPHHHDSDFEEDCVAGHDHNRDHRHHGDPKHSNGKCNNNANDHKKRKKKSHRTANTGTTLLVLIAVMAFIFMVGLLLWWLVVPSRRRHRHRQQAAIVTVALTPPHPHEERAPQWTEYDQDEDDEFKYDDEEDEDEAADDYNNYYDEFKYNDDDDDAGMRIGVNV